MSRIKFLHFGDLHLDTPFSSLGTVGGISSIRRNDIRETFNNIVGLARKEEVDIILISGDLYEQGYTGKSSINFINNKFSELPDIEVFIIPGNHDPYLENSYYKNFIWAKNVHILSHENPCVINNRLNTCVYGFGFSGFTDVRQSVKDFKGIDEDYINILLVHGTADMNVSGNNYNPMTSRELSETNMDYIALGHFHNCIKDIGGYGNIYNPGSPEPLGFDEEGIHGIFTGEIIKENNNSRLNIDFKKMSKRNYFKREIEISGYNTNEQIAERIKEEGLNGPDLYNVILKGYTEDVFKVDCQFIESQLEGRVFYLKITDDTRPDFDFESIRKETGLRGVFVRKMFALIDSKGDEREKQLLTKALYYGLEAMEYGKVSIS